MEKILIIEDELSIAELERDYLEVHGYECHIVNDGEEGYNQALSNSYDNYFGFNASRNGWLYVM